MHTRRLRPFRAALRPRIRPMDRRRFVGLCAGSLALAAAGCRRTGDPAYARGPIMVMAVPDVNSIKPDWYDLDKLLFPLLAVMDENEDLEPRFARSWESSADKLEWTYNLRTDLRWSDGAAVTAHDVKFTLDLLQHPDVAEYFFDSVTVLDDYTVKIRSAFAYQDDITFFPKHVLERLEPKGYMDWDFWLHPTVSAGPYRFVRYVPDTMMELEANPNYYRGRQKIERVILKFVGQAGLAELLSGNADVVLYADPAQIPFVAKDPRFRVYQSIGPVAEAIYWKCDHPLFRDPRVRRALTLAIDRHALLEVLNLPSDLPITDGVFTNQQFRRRQFPEPLPYDPEQARALLEAAGWQDHDGDGVREREGRRFSFTAIVGSVDMQGRDRLAVYVQVMLRRVGVHMDIQMLDTSQASLDTGDFEAIFRNANFDLGRFFGRNNPTGYVHPEVVRLTDQLPVTADLEEVDRIYQALTEIFRADLPLTRLIPRTTTTFAHRRVQGLSTPFHASPDTYIEDLWSETEP